MAGPSLTDGVAAKLREVRAEWDMEARVRRLEDAQAADDERRRRWRRALVRIAWSVIGAAVASGVGWAFAVLQ